MGARGRQGPGVHYPTSRSRGRSEHQARVEQQEYRRKVLRSHPAYPIEGRLTPAEAIDYRNADPLICLLCGRGLQQLGRHLIMVHDTTSKAYCELYAIPWRWKGSQGLVTRAQSRRMSEAVPKAQVERTRRMGLKWGKVNQQAGIPGKVAMAVLTAGSAVAWRKCRQCRKEFKPHKARGMYCSHACFGKTCQRTDWRKCMDCGKELPRGSQNGRVVRCKVCNFAERRRRAEA